MTTSRIVHYKTFPPRSTNPRLRFLSSTHLQRLHTCNDIYCRTPLLLNHHTNTTESPVFREKLRQNHTSRILNQLPHFKSKGERLKHRRRFRRRSRASTPKTLGHRQSPESPEASGPLKGVFREFKKTKKVCMQCII